MAKAETGLTDTGEQENPLNPKRRRTTVPNAEDAQARTGDGVFSEDGARATAVNYGRAPLGYAKRRRLGMR